MAENRVRFNWSQLRSTRQDRIISNYIREHLAISIKTVTGRLKKISRCRGEQRNSPEKILNLTSSKMYILL